MSAELESNSKAAPPRATVLICDDEDGPREALKAIFRGEHEVLAAHSGPQAIELAQQHRIDVAVCDIRMSGMSGIEVLERLKFLDPGVEVVMMTAFETTDTLRQALRLQAFDYINKPFDVPTVRAAVAGALQKRRTGDAAGDSGDRINALFAELQHQKIEEQISRARSEIYASIIHDINGPLTVISGFLQLLNQRLAGVTQPTVADLEFVKDRLKTITRQTGSCIEISRRYLSFLRKTESEDAPRIGLNQILADVNQLVQGHPSLGRHEFMIHPLERDVAARMNGTDLIQMLRNLIVNALQAGPGPYQVEVSGRVLEETVDLGRLRDSAGERVLNVEAFDNTPPAVMITVRDTGPGIPAEVLPKMFQSQFTTKASRQGTGLGLSIVLRLLREARGALHLQTEPGRGTSFTLYLPAHPGPVLPRPA